MISSFRMSTSKVLTIKRCCSSNSIKVEYIQGQSPKSGLREYFYYIDHEGFLFLDDARMKNFTSCIKDKPFLKFFFDRLKPNNTDRFKNTFPFLSICGRERNFIRCNDLPVVFTQVITDAAGTGRLSYAHAGEFLTVPFEPQKIYMSSVSGRVYHPADPKHGGIGLVRSKLSIEFSQSFVFDENEKSVEFPPPTQFTWNGTVYQLDRNWVNCLTDTSTLERTDFEN